MLKATFKIVSGNATWGGILGDIQDQTDLINLIDTTSGNLQGEIDGINATLSALGETVSDNYITLDNKIDDTKTELANDISDLQQTVSDNYNTLDGKIDDTKTELSGDISDLASTVSDNYNTLDGKIDANTSLINDLDATLSALGETVSNNYITLDGKISDNTTAINNHIADKTNPHEVTKAQVGLGNVDNTSDLNKPISTATQTALDGKQATITGAATTITSNNLTASRAVISDANGKIAVSSITSTELGYLDNVNSNIQTQFNNITDLIPNAATSSNQLADKDFVNSSISSNTANFVGTFNSVAELEAYSGTVTNNDYAFVVNSVITNNGSDWATFNALNAYDKDLLTNFDYAWVINGSNFDLYRFDILNQVWDLRVQNTPKASVTLNTAYNRYKATVSGSSVTWEFEYTLNNSSFTAAQWAAINSTATVNKINQIDTNTSTIQDIQATLSALGTAANYDATAFATSAQGTKADTAIQSVITGSANGTISVDGTDVSVYGLGSAAYTASTAYATSSQGTKADSAIQGITLNGSSVAPDANKVVALANVQSTTNLVTSVSSASTDAQYPSAKLFYDTIGNLETILHTINSGNN